MRQFLVLAIRGVELRLARVVDVAIKNRDRRLLHWLLLLACHLALSVGALSSPSCLPMLCDLC